MTTIADNVRAARETIKALDCAASEAGAVAALVLRELHREGLLPFPLDSYSPSQEPFG